MTPCQYYIILIVADSSSESIRMKLIAQVCKCLLGKCSLGFWKFCDYSFRFSLVYSSNEYVNSSVNGTNGIC